MKTISPENKALVNAYTVMMQMDAWKDLEAFARAEVEHSISQVDSRSAADLTLGYVCEERGIRKGITKLLQHAERRRVGE